jgi:quercetin dioxygenase-like cupin family protein
MLIIPILLGLAAISIGVAAQQAPKITPVAKLNATATGQKLEYPKTNKAEIESLLVEIAPGIESVRHMHPVPTYLYILEGTLTVEMDDGSRREYQAGTGFLESMNM